MMKFSAPVILLCFCTLMQAHAQQKTTPAGIDSLVDSINHLLYKYTDYHPRIRLKSDSVFVIEHAPNVFFTVNLLQLLSAQQPHSFHYKGMEAKPMVPGAHTTNSWIYFHQKNTGDTFIKFCCAGKEELLETFGLFKRLYDVMKRQAKCPGSQEQGPASGRVRDGGALPRRPTR